MRRKSGAVTRFIDGLHDFIVNNPQFRRRTQGKSETQIQAEIRPLIIRYLEEHFRAKGFKDAVAKANQSFYWEGQDGQYGKSRAPCFGTRNYPDFIITTPYVVAVEYKQSPNGSTVKHGIGQSIMHTLSGEFHFVYYLFHDESPDKQIEKSITNPMESFIIEKVKNDFNVYIKFV